MNPFSLLAGIGAAMGLFRLPPRLLKTGLMVLGAALVGARLEYVLVNSAVFRANALGAIMLWEGGLGWAGALAGAILVVCILAAVRRMRLAVLADGLLPMLLPLVVMLWLGCWQSGAAFGAPIGGAWWAVPGRDDLGITATRWPVQPAGALASLLGLAFLEKQRTRLKAPGASTCLSLAWLTGVIAALSPVMADPAPTVLGMRLYTLEALALTAASLTLAAAAWLASHLVKGAALREQRLSS